MKAKVVVAERCCLEAASGYIVVVYRQVVTLILILEKTACTDADVIQKA